MTADSKRARAVRDACGLFRLQDRGVVRVRGRDRVRWLDGMLSAHIAALEPGPRRSGCYALLLTPKGAIVADFHVLLTAQDLWLETAVPAIPSVLERFERHIIADDVGLEDASGQLAQLALEGPAVPSILAAAAGRPVELAPEACCEIELAGHPVMCAAQGWSGESAFRLFTAREAVDEIAETLMAAGREHGLLSASRAVLEILRIEAGTPLLGADLDEDVLPDEARLERAISTSKGCYVGQEIVARLRSRGRVNHLLVGFRFSAGDPPEPETAVHAAGRRTGEVTSVCRSDELGPIGLGFVRREHAEPGTEVSVGSTAATVSALPFVPARSPARHGREQT